jgi:hypothetical protein
MHDIVSYVYNNVPMDRCGSSERVNAWLYQVEEEEEEEEEEE